MKKWKVLITICLILFILFFIQFAIIAPSLDWTWHFIREIEYPIPFWGMIGSLVGIGLCTLGEMYENQRKGKK